MDDIAVVSMKAQATAVVMGTFLSGIMAGLALIMVPVLLDVNTSTSHLLHQWVCLYNYGHRVLPAISIATLLMYGYIGFDKWTSGGPWISYAMAGGLTVGIIPFTLIVMLSSNNELFEMDAQIQHDPKATSMKDARTLVAKWSRMHLLRSMFPLAGAVLGFTTLLKEM